MKNTTCLLLLLFCTHVAMAQSTAPARRPGEIIIHLEPGASLQNALSELDRSAPGVFSLKNTLAKDWNIFLLDVKETQDNDAQMLAIARRVPGIHSAQWNHQVQERSIEPNDTEWWRQGDMTLINAPEVWETSTGGLTPAGDTIVVAVLEKGALLTHPDLAPNRWWNWHETPGNGVDDDGNGYKDDFGGWNPQTQADDLGTKGFHGTAVCGIIGAKGNNNEGITGVNWNIKLMNISGMDYESEIIQGYEYVGKMRRIYNQTNGKKGAFVVATNASFGFDKEFADDHPIWCALYDSLGKEGILSVGATANDNVNVDVVGDMPTTCPSEYFIAVTNINKSAIKAQNAGFGSISIDLGAPGTDTYSTYNSGGQGNEIPSYNVIGGCSAAAPHVTGGIGLLYSLGCEPFTSDALSNPIACARRVRDAILNNTEPNTTLAGITTTGGHLDLGNALDGVRKICDGATVGPLELLEIEVRDGGNMVRVHYQTPNFQPYNFRVFNMLGQQLYEKQWTPQQFSESYVDFEFDTTNLPKGVYVYTIGRGNAIKSRKIPKI
ncbi:MAG: S8 family serine peptidase [Saprospiraceae bacterium]|nr:S8 family serine peptidase [Saprospiraceae bacterium]